MDSTDVPNIYQNRYDHTSQRWKGFWHLINVWKGSVFKLIWHDFLTFVVAYYLLSILYRYVLFPYPEHRERFELLCIYCGKFASYIPITFLTGFYVSQVVTRWWSQFVSLPWPDRFALKLVTFLPGKTNFKKNLRRTVMRYVNLSTILVYRLVSPRVKERFPTLNSLVESKLMLPHEAERLQRADARTPHESTWAPLLWACKLIQKARSSKKIEIEAPVYASLIGGFEHIEECNRNVLNYGWMNFPLAYTQVATLSVFAYFFAALFGRQYLIPREYGKDPEMFPHLNNTTFSSSDPFDEHTPDMIVPIFCFIEFLSYMGWIKVAETLLNPFGSDDEDFDTNYIIDRNLQVSYLIVDEADMELEMADDPFLEAGIDIPEMAPAYDSEQLRRRSKKTIASQNSIRDKSMSPLSKNLSTSVNSVNNVKKDFVDNVNKTVTEPIKDKDKPDETMFISFNDNTVSPASDFSIELSTPEKVSDKNNPNYTSSEDAQPPV